MNVAVVAPALAVRAGLHALLSQDPEIRVAAEAASLSELQPLAGEIEVYVVAANSSWRAELEGDALLEEPAAILLLVSEQANAARLVAGLERRAWGLLPLDSSAEELLAAVHALHTGLVVGSPVIMETLLRRLPAAESQVSAAGDDALTEREAEVLQLLAQGLANKQIAARLGISEHTVKFHVSAIYAKLGAASRTEAVRLGVRQGLVIL
jgi:DNA-binding NarL/FixJ family response regulator